MKLELGSGGNPTDGYEHLDINPEAPCVEYVGDFRCLITNDYDLKLYPDMVVLQSQTEQFSEIKAIHFIEHIQWIYHETLFNVLFSLLSLGGSLTIETVDLKWIVKSYLRNSNLTLLSKIRFRKPYLFPSDSHPDCTESGNKDHFFKWVNSVLYSGCSLGDYHHCCYDAENLRSVFSKTGFKVRKLKASGGTIYGVAMKPNTTKQPNEDFFKGEPNFS